MPVILYTVYPVYCHPVSDPLKVYFHHFASEEPESKRLSYLPKIMQCTRGGTKI